MSIMLTIFFGSIVGFAGGVLGIGGGALMVPAFVMFWGMTQHQAHGTSLVAMLPPVFILAVWRYWQAGNVDLKVGIFTAIGIFLGAFLGAHAVHQIPASVLKKIFGVFLLIMSVKMIFFK